MSQYYRATRTKNIYDPESRAPFWLSRSKLDNFLSCPRCFYLDRRLGVGQPPGYPFNLNSAVDSLLKKEFDSYRRKGEPHPLMVEAGIDAIPYKHKDLDTWRDTFKGIRFHHEESNFELSGAIDDLWADKEGKLIVVDYKATAKDGEVSLDAEWQDGYKRQMEIYQWLFRQEGYPVSETGYFVYCNGDKSKERFDAMLSFSIKVIPYTGDDSWVGKSLLDAATCLRTNSVPPRNKDCDYCAYREAAGNALYKAKRSETEG